MVSLCSAHQYASNDIHFYLEVTLRSRYLRSPLDLDPMRSWYTYSDAYQCVDLDGGVSFSLAWLVHQTLLAKIPLFSSAAILILFTPVTSFLTWPKNDLGKNCKVCPLVPNAVFRLSLSLLRFLYLGGGAVSRPPSVLRWPRLPSVRGLKHVL